MDTVHNAIAWYQKKIGSYDKQLWEESVERKLLKVPPNVKNAPKKSVRLKTEYIDVDLIRGSTFTKTKPQVPWIYITRKALARLIFFPFYYKWWVLQTSLKLYLLLLGLYFLQLISVIVYLRNLDHSIVEDELSFTEVTLPVILMYLLCLVHSQTVLAHIGHKPPKRTKPIPRVIRQPKNKKATKKGQRSSGNNSSVCQDDGLGSSKSPRTEDSKRAVSVDKTNDASKGQYSADEAFSFPETSERLTPSRFDSNKERLRRKVERNIQDRKSQPSVSLKKSGNGASCNGGGNVDRVTLDGCDTSKFQEEKVETSYEKYGTENIDVIKHNGTRKYSSEEENCTDLLDHATQSIENCDSVNKVAAQQDTQRDTAMLEREHVTDNVGKHDTSVGNRNGCPRHFTEDSESLSTAPVNVARKRGVDNVEDSGIQSNMSSDSSCSCPLNAMPDSVSAHTLVANAQSITDATLYEIPDLSTSSIVNSPQELVVTHLGISGGEIHEISGVSSAGDIKSTDLSSTTTCDNIDQRNHHLKYLYSDCTSSSSPASCQNMVVESNNPMRDPPPSYHVDCQHDIHTRDNNPSVNSSSVNSFKGNNSYSPLEPTSGIQSFSELFVQEILNADTLREVSSTVLLANSDLECSSSSLTGQSFSSSSSFSNSTSLANSLSITTVQDLSVSEPISIDTSSTTDVSSTCTTIASASVATNPSSSSFRNLPKRRQFADRLSIQQEGKEENPNAVVNTSLDESMEIMAASDAERTSDVSNYSPSESEPDSDAAGLEDLRNRCEEKRKRLRFQELNNIPASSGSLSPHMSTSGSYKIDSGSSKGTVNGNGANVSRSMVNALTRKPSPLKDLSLSRKSSGAATVSTHSSASDVGKPESTRSSCLRRRRRTSGNIGETEASRSRSVPNAHSPHAQENNKMMSSSENEIGEGYTGEGSNKAAMSSEEWEDRIPLDESTSSNYSSSCGSESETNNREGEDMEEEEEKTEYTTSTLHVINLLQPQSGSPSSSGNVAQPDKVSCLIWEMNECKKVDLTALDIGWAIIDKVDSLPESSDYFLIGLLFSFLMGMVPLAFRAFVNKNWTSFDELLSWSGLVNRTMQIPDWVMEYTWRQNLLMVNGILQRFFLSLLFFFLLSVADRTFKQRLLYAKHFSYLTSSRRARKFSMPHFRLNKVRNIKIWLSLRSYLKRRGPQRSVDVIVSASFMCGISTVCLISLQMLKDSGNYLDFLCNWELLVWCLALAVFLLRFMTLGLKINKKYRNLSVLITEQINLYLQMEQKPHKKEELVLANNVLRLAEDLLKELESPFKISGFSANPFIYNITKVIVLSAFSAVLTELLGFKLKLHKIKLKG